MSQFLAETDPRLGEIKSKTQIFYLIWEVLSHTASGALFHQYFII